MILQFYAFSTTLNNSNNYFYCSLKITKITANYCILVKITENAVIYYTFAKLHKTCTKW